MKKTTPVSRSGRFAGGPAAAVAQFTESISFDRRLWRQDIAGSMAHATMLRQAGFLTHRELRAIIQGLDAIGKEIKAGKFRWQPELEDVHMNIEVGADAAGAGGGQAAHGPLAQRPGGAGHAPLAAGANRGAAAGDSRMLAARAGGAGRAGAATWSSRATRICSGRSRSIWRITCWPTWRCWSATAQRLQECLARVNVCPLGSGALAGSTLPLDRELVAELLGFVDAQGRPQVTQNSMDAVSDRDFAVEFCSSRGAARGAPLAAGGGPGSLVEREFNFIRIADAYTTGSSLMPQKKNPDVAELIRGKSGRLIGNLVALLTLLKGLPMTYNRDLQEDKERLFDTADTVRAAVRLCAAMLEHTKVNRAACLAAASDPALLATDLADYLVRKGLPFRQAHHAVGALVALAERLGKPLNQLTLAELRSVERKFGRGRAEGVRSQAGPGPAPAHGCAGDERKSGSNWRGGRS